MAEDIPRNHHVVRTVGKHKCDLALDGHTITVESGVFLPREDYPLGFGPEPFVSVDWLEYFSGSLQKQLGRVRDAVAARGRTVGKQARLATVLVDNVHKAARMGNKTVIVSTTGEVNDPSHSGIYGLEPSDDKIAQEIALRAVAHPAYS